MLTDFVVVISYVMTPKVFLPMFSCTYVIGMLGTYPLDHLRVNIMVIKPVRRLTLVDPDRREAEGPP